MPVPEEKFVPSALKNKRPKAAPQGCLNDAEGNEIAKYASFSSRTNRQQGSAPEPAYRKIILFSLVPGENARAPIQ